MFIVVVINTLLQGPTLPWAARRLRVISPAEPLDLGRRGGAAGGPARRPAVGRVPPGSRLHGVEVFELRLPAGANVALIVRDGQGFVPAPPPACAPGTGCSSSPRPAVREQTERRLRAVSRAGKLARWLGERGQ